MHILLRAVAAILLGTLDSAPLLHVASCAIAVLRRSDGNALERLASSYLTGAVAKTDIVTTLYIAAALQVYFMRAAATLELLLLRPLKNQGLCSCCGSPSVSVVIIASGVTHGARYLTC